MGRKAAPRPDTVARMLRDWPADKLIFDDYRARMPAQPKRGDREAAIAATAKCRGMDERTVERAVARQAAAEKFARAATETLSVVVCPLPRMQFELDAGELEYLEQLDLPTLRKLRKQAASKRRQEKKITRR